MLKPMNKKGFTLIELILVMAILGIIMGLVIPSFKFGNYYLKSLSKELYSDIRYVRMLNMTEGSDYKIYLGDGLYKISSGIKDIKVVNIRPEYKLFPPREYISFSPQGAPVYKEKTITIKNMKNGNYMEMTIVPASGRVLLKDEIYSSK